MDPLIKHLQTVLKENGMEFATATHEALFAYLKLLHQWNQTINLTAVRDLKEMMTHHILDSLLIAPFCTGTRLADVGSGAGLPGIPLAIIFPEKEFVLVESIAKKTYFLENVIRKLNLSNVSVIHSRVEKYHPDNCFDHVITRAFSSLTEMLTLTQHLLCKNGEFLAMKGIYPHEELKVIPSDFKVIAVQELKIKNWDRERCIVRLSLCHSD